MTTINEARLALLFALSIGCGESSSTPDASSSIDAPAGDASGGLPTTCEGTCATTALEAKFGSATRVLDLGFYGITKTPSGSTLFVEVHRNAPARCPQETDPAPDYTLILGRVPIPSSTASVTSPGVLFDYQEDLLGGDIKRTATSVMLAPVAANVCESCVGMPSPSDPDGMIALDASLVFNGGTVAGHLYAIHCDSMDVQEQ